MWILFITLFPIFLTLNHWRNFNSYKIPQKFPQTFLSQEWDFDPVIPFPPVIENSYDSEDEAFLPSFRYSKHSFDIPWMLGFTSEEGLIKLAGEFTQFWRHDYSLMSHHMGGFL